MLPQHRALVLRLLSLVAIGLTCLSCTKSETSHQAAENSRPPELPSMKASAFLGNAFSRYANTSSYRDEGRVRLRVSVDDEILSETAPLSIQLHESRFLLQAYDVRMWADANQILAWMEDPTTNHHDSQVRVQARKTSARPTPSELVADPIISTRLQSGLGGTAPQLDWLFAEKPMEKLFAEDHRIVYDGVKAMNDQWCVIVQVQSDDQIYRFWISRRSSTIRRVELPPPDIDTIRHSLVNADAMIKVLSFEIDLANATFDAPATPLLRPPLPNGPRFVSELVPLPPTRPIDKIGRSLPDLRLHDRERKIPLTSRGTDREITVGLMVGESDSEPLSREQFDRQLMNSYATLARWNQMLSPALLGRVRVIVVESGKRSLPLGSSTALPLFPDDQEILRRHAGLSIGDVFVIDPSGVLAWIQQGISEPGLPGFGAIVADVLNGVNVPQRLQDQWAQDQTAYEKRLSEVRQR